MSIFEYYPIAILELCYAAKVQVVHRPVKLDDILSDSDQQEYFLQLPNGESLGQGQRSEKLYFAVAIESTDENQQELFDQEFPGIVRVPPRQAIDGSYCQVNFMYQILQTKAPHVIHRPENLESAVDMGLPEFDQALLAGKENFIKALKALGFTPVEQELYIRMSADNYQIGIKPDLHP